MSALVLVTASDSRQARLDEFRASARRIASLWGDDTRIAAVDCGEDIAAAIDSHYSSISRLALVMHGGWCWLLASDRGVRRESQRPPRQISIEYLARVLAPRLAEDAHVALAACWAGASRPSAALVLSGGWAADGSHYAPGGCGSLADDLHAWLRRLTGSRVTLTAHTTRGHTTRNPCLRRWSPAERGASLLDAAHGAGAWKDHRVRARWTRLRLPPKERDPASVAPAERLLAGC